MSWDEVKDEKEGYVRVRKSDDRALIGRLKKANDDPEAKGYIELNKDDLGGMGGGSGPHSHSEYASSTHDHADLRDLIKVEHDKNTQQDGRLGSIEAKQSSTTEDIADLYALADKKADTTHTHDDALQRLEQDEAEIADLVKRLEVDESNISKNRQKIDNIQGSINDINNNKSPGKADADHTHDDLGGGASYDDTEVRDLIQANADSIAEIQTKGYDDTELSGRVSDTETKNTQQDGRLGSLESKQSSTDEDIADLYALADKKADTDHTHDAPEGMVTSDSVTSIVRLSQTEFDALADKDASTLYLVV